MIKPSFISSVMVPFVLLLLLANSAMGISLFDQCVLESVSNSAEERTVGEIRKQCEEATAAPVGEKEAQLAEEEDSSAIEQRAALEDLAQELPFLLVPHYKNYVLPITYNSSSNSSPFEDEELELDEAEIKFQFSLKSRLVKKMFWGQGDLWLAYTNLSFWQAYNKNESSPFRETNHQPELFVDFNPDLNIAGWRSSLFRIGAVHQSNGRGGSNSRSWNRVYALFALERGNWYFGLKPWYRIPESEKEGPDDPRGDDNPDIHSFLGYGELYAFYRGDNHRVAATFRNNLRSNNRMGLQLDWSYPISERTRAYIQYFNGYGESLIDYDDSTNRLGIGLLFSETL